MKRRDLLASVAALGTAGALAGCVSQLDDGDSNSGGGGANPDDGGGDGGGDGGTTTTPPTPSIAGAEFVDAKAGCGEGNEAEISFDDGALAVEVVGTLTASDPCHHPEFVETSYDPEGDELTVVVGVTPDESADMCTQCLAAVDYEAVVRFDGALPGSVSVGHVGMGDEGTVATESR